MAAPPKIKRLSREDFKDAPAWIDRLLYWLNVLIEYITLSFDHGITFDENIQSQIKTFSLVAGAAATNNTVSFMSTMRVAPRLLLVGRVVDTSTANYAPLAQAVSVEWRYENGSVFITSITGLTSSKSYDVTVLLI